jgi:hypothetical protein
MRNVTTARPIDTRANDAIALPQERTWTPHQMVRRAAAFGLAFWFILGVIVWIFATS